MEHKPEEAASLYQQALALFRQDGDRRGEARCQIGIGNIHQRAGQLGEAESAYNLGLECAESARAADLAGLAALSLGVLHLARGQSDLASARYGEALDRFTSSSNESYRLMTLFNMAHLARENEDWARRPCSTSRSWPSRDASANRTWSSVRVPARRSRRWRSANARSRKTQCAGFAPTSRRGRSGGSRGAISSMHCASGWPPSAVTTPMRFGCCSDAVELAERFNPYVAAYLVLECAPSLRQQSNDALLAIVDRVRPAANRLGLHRHRAASRVAALRLARKQRRRLTSGRPAAAA